MAYWNDPRVRVLRKYGVLIDAEPEVLKRVPGKLPAADGDMTFNQWKLAIFGEPVDVGVFSLECPAPNTRMKTLSGWGGDYVRQVLSHQSKVAKRQKQEELEALQQELAEAAGEAHMPKELLEAEVDDLEDTLQPSVRQFFDRELKDVEDDVSVDQLFQKMLSFINSAAAGATQARRGEERYQRQAEQLQRQVEELQQKLDELNRET